MAKESFEKQKYWELLEILKESSPYDFTGYSNNSLDRRIDKILEDNNLTTEQLIYKLKTNEEFVEYFVEAITVNTTELFRDPEMWKRLIAELDNLKNKPSINIWHAGCSTGQEVYSNIILLNQLGLLEKANIYASDISKIAIKKAKKGIYPYKFNIEKYLDNYEKVFDKETSYDFYKYFNVDETEDILTINESFLDKVNFFHHDLIKGKLPVDIKFDIIFCRNVLIYFSNHLQNEIANRFYKRISTGGYLILGAHESLSGFFKTKFTEKHLLYIKNNMFHFKY